MIEALIVTYNSRGEIEECLDAVQAAGVRAAVLDNLSPDGTAGVVAERYPWVRLIRSEINLGFGGGTNELARTSDADFLMLLNPDAILTPDTPAALQAGLEGDPGAIAAGPRLIYPNGERQPSNHRFPDLTYEIARVVANTRFSQFGRWDGIAHNDRVMQWSWDGGNRAEHTDALWATCWLMRADDVRSHGLFDPAFPMYDEDLDFCARMQKQGRQFLYVPSTTVVHYGGSSSTSEHKIRMARRARYLYYRRHHGLVYAEMFRSLTGGLERAIRLARSV